MDKNLNKRVRRILHEEILKLCPNIVESKYRMNDIDELSEYMWLKPNVTGLDVDIFVDDGGAFLRHGHELLLFARNGYNKGFNEYIPFSITTKPKVLDDEMDFNITYDSIFLIQDFIQYNLQTLIKLANDMISQEGFVKSIRMANSQYGLVSETMERLDEMATLKMSDSHLPMDIWLDEGGTYHGHAPRIKFRASNDQRTTREFSTMLIANPPTIENMPSNSPIRKKDLEKLRNFVIKNQDNLLKLANGEIDYLTEFKPNMILD